MNKTQHEILLADLQRYRAELEHVNKRITDLFATLIGEIHTQALLNIAVRLREKDIQ